jgi:hypothetical protein
MPESRFGIWVDEARYLRLYAKLDEALGTEEALTLMELLVPARFERPADPTSLRDVSGR